MTYKGLVDIFYINKVRKVLRKIITKMNIHLLMFLTGITAIHIGWNMIQKYRPEKDRRKHPFIELYNDLTKSSDNK